MGPGAAKAAQSDERVGARCEGPDGVKVAHAAAHGVRGGPAG